MQGIPAKMKVVLLKGEGGFEAGEVLVKVGAGIRRLGYRPPHPLAPVNRKASRSTIAPIVALMTRPMIPEPK